MKTASKHAIVGVYKTHNQAEEAVKALKNAGVHMKHISILGRGFHTEEHPIGYYNTGDRVKTWGSRGAFWGGLWGLVFGSAFFWIPGIGPLFLAGPLVTALVGAVEGAVVVGGLSALGAAMVSIGIPKDSVMQYEKEIKTDKFLVIATGDEAQTEQAHRILENTTTESLKAYRD